MKNKIDKKYIMLAKFYLLADIFDVADRGEINLNSDDLTLEAPIYDEFFLNNLILITKGDIDGYINRLAYKFSNVITEMEMLYVKLGMQISKKCNIKVLSNKNCFNINNFKQGLNAPYTDLRDVDDDGINVEEVLNKYIKVN